MGDGARNLTVPTAALQAFQTPTLLGGNSHAINQTRGRLQFSVSRHHSLRRAV